MVLVICLIGLLVASAFGIFFSGEDSGTGHTMPEYFNMLNNRVLQTASSMIKAENPHDELDMDNAGSAAVILTGGMCWLLHAKKVTTTDASSPDERRRR